MNEYLLDDLVWPHTRDQAIALVGLDAIEEVDAENCELTNRVGYRGAAYGEPLTERAAYVHCVDQAGNKCTLTAYYYATNEEDRAISEPDADGSEIDWKIAEYEVN